MLYDCQIGWITLSWLTPFQSHLDSKSSSIRCLSSGIDLLRGDLLAGRLPCSRLSASSTRVLPGLLFPAHTCSAFLELFHGQCNGRNIKNKNNLLKVTLLLRVHDIASTILTMHRQQHQTRTKRKTSDLSYRVGFISSWYKHCFGMLDPAITELYVLYQAYFGEGEVGCY